MKIIADLQIHSKYARAVSKYMDLSEINKWSRLKGIQLVATGDWTHPAWFASINEELTEVRPGIFHLKEDHNSVDFLLSAEVSCIYSHNGRLRRVHHLIFSPSLSACRKVIAALELRGAKLASDGRPVIGISSRSLLELVLEADERCMVIPAHVWTPWFGLFGSKSGYDSIEEAFGDLSNYIYAIETGLSSDPIMNWAIPELKNRSIVSFSDAHSGPKLGREATVFVTRHEAGDVRHEQSKHTSKLKTHTLSYNYSDIVGAIKQDQGSRLQIGYAIEFFPEEGKYHWSGHRDCKVRLSTTELLKNGPLCPVCKRGLTVGVEKRVIDVSHADHLPRTSVKTDEYGVQFIHDAQALRKPFVSCVPLLELVQEVLKSPTKAKREYDRLILDLGPEFEILLEKPLSEIERVGGEQLAKAIKNVRERRVRIEPGYDGEFGSVSTLE